MSFGDPKWDWQLAVPVHNSIICTHYVQGGRCCGHTLQKFYASIHTAYTTAACTAGQPIDHAVIGHGGTTCLAWLALHRLYVFCMYTARTPSWQLLSINAARQPAFEDKWSVVTYSTPDSTRLLLNDTRHQGLL